MKREDSPAILEREEEKIEEKEELIEPPKAPEIDPKNLLSPVPDVVIDRPESRASQFSQPPDAEGGEVRESWDSKITFIFCPLHHKYFDSHRVSFFSGLRLAKILMMEYRVSLVVALSVFYLSLICLRWKNF